MSESKAPPPSFFPRDFYCPITLELFENPYIGPSNLTFEYDALVSHFAISDKHPITRVKCSLAEFGPNISLRNSIESLQKEYAKRNIAMATTLPPIKKGPDRISFSKKIIEMDNLQTGIITVTNATEQPGSDVTIIIDHSGSMGASAALKGEDGHMRENGLSLQDVTNASAIAFLESLSETDRASVVKYNSNVTVVSPLSFATSAFKQDMATKIKAIRSGGQTNIWGALRVSLEQYRKNSVTDRKQTIILLTDGRPNVCPTRGEKYALNSWYEQYPDQKIDIHTVGFGNSIDSELLEDIATIGLGTYNFLSSPDMIGTIFVNLAANCLSSSCIMPIVDIRLSNGNKFAVTPIPGMTSQITRLADNHIRVRCPRLKCNAPFSLAFELNPSNKTNTKDIIVNGSPFCATCLTNASCGVHTLPSCMACMHPVARGKLYNHCARNIIIKGIEKINNYLSMGSYALVPPVYSNSLKDLQQLSSRCMMFPDTILPFIEDWTKQVKEAANLSTQPGGESFWQTWGKHWLKSLKMAHMYQYTNNFRDPGIQGYGKNCTLFEVLQDKITKIFDTLPPPEPSIQVAPERRCRSMAVYNNHAYDGCFDGDCIIKMQIRDSCTRSMKVKNLQKGDVVYCNDKDCDIVECVVRTRCTQEESGQPCAVYRKFKSGLMITPWHPIKYDNLNNWSFPENYTDATTVNKSCEFVYDVVLRNRTPTLLVNNIMVATLGHGQRGEVIGHEYSGDRIIDDLKKLDGYNKGLVTTGGFKRNSESGLIDGLNN